MTTTFHHQPIMPQEILKHLDLQPGSIVVDATAGGGGHLRLLAEAVGPTGLAIGIDQDPRAHELDAAGGAARDYPQVKLFRARFSELPSILKQEGIEQIDALLADLGVSSPQLDTAERGLSFQQDGPLDMRMDPEHGISAYELIQQSSESELADLIYQFGEERFSRRIARNIKSQKELPNSTLALAALVAQSYRGPRSRIHPATRTFQALRIAVNQELDEIQSLLKNLESILKVGGKAAFLSFHSLEDGPIKHFFKNQPQTWARLFKKPLAPTESELFQNPRAKSAKLRIVQRIHV